MDDQIEDKGEPEAKYGLPRKVLFCKKCVISNQRPSSTVEFKHSKDEKKKTIGFDEKGVCDACRYTEWKKNRIDWGKREKELIELCDRHRSKDGSYDCVIPGSGGKDSGFTAHILKYKYGMHPLTVTWAPHKYTEIGFQNFQAWIHAGFDNILFTPNGRVHRLLTKLAFHNLFHPFQPFIIGQKYIGPKYALMHNVKLVFYGENQAEYGNNIDENENPKMDMKFFSEGKLDELKISGQSIKELMNKHSITMNDLQPYLPLNKEELEKTDVQVHYLGYYLKWDPQECFYYCVKNTGFRPNTERTEGSYSKYSSIDDMIDPFHYFTTYIKFGIGRATYDASQEIRNEKITREEGVALVKKFDSEFPTKFFKEFLKYIDLDEKTFWETVNRFRSPHLWIKEDNEWKLRKAVYN
ncbi:MAG: N-acetyl sugar amidotransferase [Nanoarchaeota archaeon]|nr:N-acetyl sugar amidotransferase [Nanoarchaeota archaeon]